MLNDVLGESPDHPDLDVSDVVDNFYRETPINPRAARYLLGGGPVGQEGAFYLHSGPPAGTERRCYQDRGSGANLVGADGRRIEEPMEDDEGPGAEGNKVLDGVYFLSSAAFMKCALRDPSGPELRVFKGYTGWGARQIDGEWRRGDWLLCEATADLVFSEPQKLWRTLTYTPLGMRLCSSVGENMA